ncbi:hypothetical protein RF11_00206 [Thelohanellus kitauei]|uniref:Tc1-like transposase DDE domain-containing protein n=1 Tax=Thelohanellus kitauei TaxID=669202 RepID=A0A0C2N5N3_THEKT|nr:hypothetical protein RF11_00206 [Thelohanellus kitauei]
MDNVRFHNSSSVSAFIQTRVYNIIFLPAYSPQLNPTELPFSKWKLIVKRSITVFGNERLYEVLRSASAEIIQNDCEGCERIYLIRIKSSPTVAFLKYIRAIFFTLNLLLIENVFTLNLGREMV